MAEAPPPSVYQHVWGQVECDDSSLDRGDSKQTKYTNSRPKWTFLIVTVEFGECAYLKTLLQVWAGVHKINPQDKHKNVHTLRTESGYVTRAGKHWGRVNYSQGKVRLRPLPPEKFGEISVKELALGGWRITWNARSCLEFLSTWETSSLSSSSSSLLSLSPFTKLFFVTETKPSL